MITSETIEEARRVYSETGSLREAALVFVYRGRGINMAHACRICRKHGIGTEEK